MNELLTTDEKGFRQFSSVGLEPLPLLTDGILYIPSVSSRGRS